MTAQTSVVNKAAFEQGDRPQGSDYINLIDSFVNLVDTTAQTMASDLTVGGTLNANRALLATVEAHICSAGVVVAGQFQCQATAFASSLIISGLANVGKLYVSNVTATSLTSAQVLTAFSTANPAHLWLMKVVVNGSTIAVPCFRSSVHWF